MGGGGGGGGRGGKGVQKSFTAAIKTQNPEGSGQSHTSEEATHIIGVDMPYLFVLFFNCAFLLVSVIKDDIKD